MARPTVAWMRAQTASKALGMLNRAPFPVSSPCEFASVDPASGAVAPRLRVTACPPRAGTTSAQVMPVRELRATAIGLASVAGMAAAVAMRPSRSLRRPSREFGREVGIWSPVVGAEVAPEERW